MFEIKELTAPIAVVIAALIAAFVAFANNVINLRSQKGIRLQRSETPGFSVRFNGDFWAVHLTRKSGKIIPSLHRYSCKVKKGEIKGVRFELGDARQYDPKKENPSKEYIVRGNIYGMNVVLNEFCEHQGELATTLICDSSQHDAIKGIYCSSANMDVVKTEKFIAPILFYRNMAISDAVKILNDLSVGTVYDMNSK